MVVLTDIFFFFRLEKRTMYDEVTRRFFTSSCDRDVNAGDKIVSFTVTYHLLYM